MNSPDAIIHHFNRSLQKSHELNLEFDWVGLYKRIWPAALTVVRVDKDSIGQRRGVDRMVWLANNKQIFIDEKVREKDYGDILLEIWSVGQFNGDRYIGTKAGWSVDDDKICDYVAYAIPSAKKCYLLPFELMKNAIKENLDAWIERAWIKGKGGDRRIRWPVNAKNATYITRSIAVTWDLLKSAINQQMFHSFADAAVEELPVAKDKQYSTDRQMEFIWGDEH